MPNTNPSAHRCRAEIDLDALRHNARICRERFGAGRGLMAIVKADGYGHGLERIAAALRDIAGWFGVANAAEAERVQSVLTPASGLRDRILILGPALPEDHEPIARAGIAVGVSDAGEIRSFAAAAGRAGRRARLHLCVDTGMGRMGADPADAPGLVESALAEPGVELQAIWSHFPVADEDESFTREQIETFRQLTESLRPKFPAPPLLHLANSAGVLHFAKPLAFTDLSRTGLALYGVSPLAEYQPLLKPVMRLATRVTLIRRLPAGRSISYGRTFITPRETLAATLGAGYGDGYPRHLSGAGAEVLIRGRRCPLLGRVTMDQVVVDVTDLPELPAPGDEAVLIGRQGDEEITAAELARKSGTIPWEIFTGITRRVARIYSENVPPGAS